MLRRPRCLADRDDFDAVHRATTTAVAVAFRRSVAQVAATTVTAPSMRAARSTTA